eukprot:2056366-Alexandrium_andersonii.AAC.1
MASWALSLALFLSLTPSSEGIHVSSHLQGGDGGTSLRRDGGYGPLRKRPVHQSRNGHQAMRACPCPGGVLGFLQFTR